MTGPSMADQPHQVRLTSNGLSGTVEVDGADVSAQVQGYNLEARVGSAPLLVLYTRPGQGGVAFEGLAHVAIGGEQDPGPSIAAFLASIEPAALQRAALDRGDLENSKTGVTAAILAQLTDWAQGSS
ncbi:hypothetical protein ACIBI8_37635 [Streptomyces sp. NPDC050529]|uniref:hypothetical protein n=1 Tax=Streptomyces sp. NPDC050529 TaxID=3365624 RepID=UPI003797543A